MLGDGMLATISLSTFYNLGLIAVVGCPKDDGNQNEKSVTLWQTLNESPFYKKINVKFFFKKNNN